MPINNIKFTTETPSDVNEELMERFDISVVPLHVNVNNKDYKDQIELDAQGVVDIYKETGALPNTSAVSVLEYEDFWKPFLDAGNIIVHNAMSSGISSTYQNACIAAKDLDPKGNRIYVLNSKGLSGQTALPIYKCGEMAENGASVEEIVKAMDEYNQKVDKTFIITSLEFLRHGGRCSALAAFGANLLKLKPLISMEGGSMSVPKKYRGSDEKVYLEYFRDRLDHAGDYDDEYCIITGVLLDPDLLKKVEDLVKKEYHFQHIVYHPCSCVITSHGGPGAILVGFLHK